jgi:hypothetical protein
LHQDAKLYAALVDGAEVANLEPSPGRLVYVHIVRGAVSVNGTALQGGDAVELSGGDNKVRLDKGSNAEVLVFDLAQ